MLSLRQTLTCCTVTGPSLRVLLTDKSFNDRTCRRPDAHAQPASDADLCSGWYTETGAEGIFADHVRPPGVDRVPSDDEVSDNEDAGASQNGRWCVPLLLEPPLRLPALAPLQQGCWPQSCCT